MIVISLLKIWSSCEEDAGKMYKKNGDDEEKDGKDKKTGYEIKQQVIEK